MANQLIDSFDYDDGTTSFYYDGNGNLVEQLLPGSPTQHLHYQYNQRNLLVASQKQVGTGPLSPVVAYGYDGANNRLAQTDYTPAGPAGTSYTNDVLGLSQVLVSDGEAGQFYNLFGLDLISQQTLSQTRTLLPDGLGSVRTEMVGSAIHTLTTYEPFGNLLAQTGSSGTTYGFTGEQFDSTTGLLYLRARYYNPALNQFQSRDPFPGYVNLPASQHGYSYVHNNPVNYTDPSGMWRWRLSGNIYHMIVENYFEGHFFMTNSSRQLEYTIPGYGTRPDMFDSTTGAVYEVEPWYLASAGIIQARNYAIQLNAARSNLHGFYLGVWRYDWTGTTFDVGGRTEWPGKLRIPLSGMLDFVADYYEPAPGTPSGLIIYWLEPKVGIALATAKASAPNKRLVKDRYWNPLTGLSPVPVPVTPISAAPPIPWLDYLTNAGIGTGVLYACREVVQRMPVPQIPEVYGLKEAFLIQYGGGGGSNMKSLRD